MGGLDGKQAILIIIITTNNTARLEVKHITKYHKQHKTKQKMKIIGWEYPEHYCSLVRPPLPEIVKVV